MTVGGRYVFTAKEARRYAAWKSKQTKAAS